MEEEQKIMMWLIGKRKNWCRTREERKLEEVGKNEKKEVVNEEELVNPTQFVMIRIYRRRDQ